MKNNKFKLRKSKAIKNLCAVMIASFSLGFASVNTKANEIGADNITFVDVQQEYAGNFVLIESNGKYGLLDAGAVHGDKNGYIKDLQRIVKYLKDRGVKKLEFVAVSHWDPDHYFTLSDHVYSETELNETILDYFEVKEVIAKELNIQKWLDEGYTGPVSKDKKFYGRAQRNYDRLREVLKSKNIPFTTFKEKDEWKLGDFTIKITNKEIPEYYKTKWKNNFIMNADSVGYLVQKTSNDGKVYNMFLANDIEGVALPEAIKELKGLGITTLDSWQHNHHSVSYWQENADSIVKEYGNDVITGITYGLDHLKSYTNENNMRKFNKLYNQYNNPYWTFDGHILFDFTDKDGLYVAQQGNNKITKSIRKSDAPNISSYKLNEKVSKDNPFYVEVPGDNVDKATIKTQEDLNNLIKKVGTDLSSVNITFENAEELIFPAGVYKFTKQTNWNLDEKSKGNIDFSKSVFLTDEAGELRLNYRGDHSNNGENQIISGLTIYATPTGKINADGIYSTDKFNGIRNLLIHAQNITFKDWTVKASMYNGVHTFDIMGSENIVVDNLKSQGKGIKNYSKEELELINKNPRAVHELYSEAIQIDYASAPSAGMLNWNNTIWKNDKQDNLASSNITIKNSTFEGYKGKTGKGLINKIDDVIDLPFGATVGSHSIKGNPYKNITIENNIFRNTINLGKNPITSAIDPIHMYLDNDTTSQSDLKSWNIINNQILDYQGENTGNAKVKESNKYITWTKSYLKPSDYLKENTEVTKTNVIDNSITVEDGNIGSQGYRLVSWPKNGEYKLQTATNKMKDEKALPASSEVLRETANDYNSPILTTGGFWSFDRLDNTGHDIKLGRTGYLASDGNNNIIAKEYNSNESIVDLMKFEGPNGWNVGAFGAIVKDGKLDEKFGKDNIWRDDKNRKSGRTIFIELNDGTQSILSINGHSSKDTGVNHTEIVEILKNIGLEKIKLAFVLDGGGSTRSYVKTDDGQDSVFGSFVDNRELGEFLYLTKDKNSKPNVKLEQNKDKLANNTSKSINYNLFIDARNKGLEKVPGTNYDTGIRYETITENIEIPYNTIYKANSNKDYNSTREIITKGENGTNIINKKYKYIDDVKQESPEITTSTKNPKSEIVEVGTKPITKVVKTPITTEFIYNDKLPEGSQKVVQEGVEGSETSNVNYELNSVTGEVQEVITKSNSPMIPEIIEIGTGKNVTSPLIVEYVADSSMEAGQREIVQEGVEEVRNVLNEIITEGRPKIIKVGIKEKVTRENIPFKQITETSNELLKGEQRIKTNGVVGEKITTVKFDLDLKTGEVIASEPNVEILEPVDEITIIGEKEEASQVIEVPSVKENEKEIVNSKEEQRNTIENHELTDSIGPKDESIKTENNEVESEKDVSNQEKQTKDISTNENKEITQSNSSSTEEVKAEQTAKQINNLTNDKKENVLKQQKTLPKTNLNYIVNLCIVGVLSFISLVLIKKSKK